ncbi:hypothetical protein JG688_00009788 [Phytophthora aleatoria]|uniref:Uncharacterized protein n=1 Tax=Phytophthora aleatoria TaxID=2496075 RepID=A0A8J5IFX1_9STRA|nr:hypothetical protein JG688_00009788 [Phytophthora aleatoria]
MAASKSPRRLHRSRYGFCCCSRIYRSCSVVTFQPWRRAYCGCYGHCGTEWTSRHRSVSSRYCGRAMNYSCHGFGCRTCSYINSNLATRESHGRLHETSDGCCSTKRSFRRCYFSSPQTNRRVQPHGFCVGRQ